MLTMGLRFLNALSERARTDLEIVPGLGATLADGLASETLSVPIPALVVGRRLILGHDDSGNGEDEESGELHCGGVGDSEVGVFSGVCSCCWLMWSLIENGVEEEWSKWLGRHFI